ncbi:unnamed protein product [Tilletia controversa]|nr:unnamed protein product [Tilletia controversa]CAD7067392.1 unnamed protein product [Tilletia caries]
MAAAAVGSAGAGEGAGAGAGPGTPVASVTYAGTLALMHSALPGHLFTTLAPHLPLHNLHWKPDPPLTYSFGTQHSAAAASAVPAVPLPPAIAPPPPPPPQAPAPATTANANPIRTIQALPLSFEPLPVALARANQIQHRLYNPTAPQNATSQIIDPAYPFLHLYLVLCPDSDTYRSTVRNDIRSWLISIAAFSAALNVSASHDPDPAPAPSATNTLTAAASEPEFLIVLITPPEGMPDLSAPQDDLELTRTGTPPSNSASHAHDPSSASNSPSPAPAPAPNPKPKPTRSSTGSASGTGGFFSSMTASKNKGASAVLEKMRADFNAGKRERVVHISRLPPLSSRPAGPHRASSVGDEHPTPPRPTSTSTSTTPTSQLDPTIFIDFLTRLKECCSHSLSVILKTRTANIRSLLGAIEVLEPGPASPYWRGHYHQTDDAERRYEGARLFAGYIQAQAFVLRCLEGLGLWEDALEGWNSVAETYMRLVLGGHDPFAPSGSAILSAAISQISLPMPHPALLKAATATKSTISPSTPTLIDPADLLPTLPEGAGAGASSTEAALEFRIALYTRRATIQGAYLGRVLHVLQEGAGEVRDIGRSLVRVRDQRIAAAAASKAQQLRNAESGAGDEAGAGAEAEAEGDAKGNEEGQVPTLEAEVWTYQAAIQLARTCDSWVADRGDGDSSTAASANGSTSSLHLGGTPSSSSSQAQVQVQVQVQVQTSAAFHAARAEMLEVARRTMDRMGVLVAQAEAEAEGRDEKVVPHAVRSLFSSREIFDLRYSSLTERVLSASMLAASSSSSSSTAPALPAAGGGSGSGGGTPTTGRRRHVLFLRIILTSLDLVRGRWKEAYTALGPLADSCAPTISAPVLIGGSSAGGQGAAGMGWAAMETVLRAQYLRCHAAMGLGRDRAWVGAVVAWLRASIGAEMSSFGTYLSLPGRERGTGVQEQEEEEEGEELTEFSEVKESTVFAALRAAAVSLEKEVAVSGFSPFEVLPAERTATREFIPDLEGQGGSSDQQQQQQQQQQTKTLDTDGHLLTVRIRSALRMDVRVDDVRLCLTNGEREQLWFTSGSIVLRGSSRSSSPSPSPSSSGEEHQVVQLYCASSASGTYAVDVAQVRIANVLFLTHLLSHSSPSSSSGAAAAGAGAGADVNTAYAPGRLLFSPGSRGVPSSAGSYAGLRSGTPFLVHIPPDPHALRACVRLPDVIRLGERRCGIVEVRTGRNVVGVLEVRLRMLLDAAGGGSSVMSGLGEAELVRSESESDAEGVKLVLPSASEGGGGDHVQLKNLPAGAVVRLRFPLLEAASLGTIPLMLSIDYYSTSSSSSSSGADDHASTTTSTTTSVTPTAPLRRQFRRVQDLLASLPLGVNAQDFFRQDFMLCKFTITSAGGSRLRIQHPRLTSARKMSVRSAEVGKDGDEKREEEEEERYIVRAPSMTTLQGTQPVAVAPKQPASFVFRLSPTDVKPREAVGGPTATVLELTLRYQAVLGPSSAVAVSVEGGDNGKDTEDEEGGDGGGANAWQTIVIPVEVPQMDLVNEVNFDFLSRSAGSPSPLPALELSAGQPVQARFTITSTDRWSRRRRVEDAASSSSSGTTTSVLLYDIVSDLDTWLICGSTRGSLTVAVGIGEARREIDVTLIPLREGSLPLPQLALKPLDAERVSSETYMVKASSRVLVSLRSRPAQFGGLLAGGAHRVAQGVAG